MDRLFSRSRWERSLSGVLATLMVVALLPIAAVVADADAADAQVGPAPLALYDFSEGAGATVGDSSGVGAPLDLTIADPGAVVWTANGLVVSGSTTIQSSGGATKVNDAVVASGEFTLEAWVVPANATQGGPARIVNIGGDPKNRNAMLGQGAWGSRPDDVFAGRARSTGSDNNGNPILFSPAGSATTGLTHVVLTRAADGSQVLYVDGVVGDADSVFGDTSNWIASFPLTLANEADGSRPWAGTLCRVAIYDVALSSGEVAVNEAAGCDVAPPVNTPPVLDPIGDQTSAPGASVVLDVDASDADGDALIFGAAGLPGGLGIDSITGEISGTVDAGAAAGSPYTVTVTVSDGEDTDDETFTWTVEANQPPVIGLIADQTSDEGDSVSVTATATDPENDALIFDANGLPAGLSINSTTGEISGTIAGIASAGSPYTVTVQVIDAASNVDDTTFTWVVNDVNTAPTIDPIADQTDAEGDTVSLQVIGNDAEGDALTYGASGLPAGLSINPSTGLISGTIDAGATAGSPYLVNVALSDGVLTELVSFSWTISEAPPAPDGLIALYDFSEGAGTTVGDSSGVGAPLDLTIADPGAVTWTVDGLEVTGNTQITSGGPATKVNTAIAASGELTIEAWIIPDNVKNDFDAFLCSLELQFCKFVP